MYSCTFSSALSCLSLASKGSPENLNNMLFCSHGGLYPIWVRCDFKGAVCPLTLSLFEVLEWNVERGGGRGQIAHVHTD